MKPAALRAAQLAAPKQQRNWDWRAAANFICGGAGGGLLLCAGLASLAAPARGAILVALLMGMGLIGLGLTCVWFEIGRPWRALNVYRHIATSWMTREAVVALAVFAGGLAAAATGSAALAFLAGICGAAFLYSQARILRANKGIPAWRQPATVALLVATGLVEGCALLAAAAGVVGPGSPNALLLVLLALVGLRALAWRRYRGALGSTGAPPAALRALDEFAPRLFWFGGILPALAVVALLLGLPGRGVVLVATAVLVAGSGAWLKYTLVRRAAFTQGLALDRLPVRGSGPAGTAARPGWDTLARG